MNIVVQTAPVVVSQNIVVPVRNGAAFQPLAFQQPGFQTSSYSQQAFQQCAFSHQGFQTDECISNGKSGYWRLFFMQMQEEALKKDEKKSVEKVVESITYEVKSPKKTVKKVEKRSVPKEEVKSAPIIPFRKLPTKLEPTVYDELVKLPEVAVEQYLFSIRATATLYNFDVEKERRRKHRRKVAAFLLMAA